ncbi:hypothetical protein CC78DRAFT_569862 [Lojkania enalia]|uniref:Carboxylesterase family protein n=1 Tax=Lojkania enalia TaxID=147567 RepID=A0A9P4N7J9_9PLEO|nr:hypothetical protein CC78DRAFT_569862 [Didymosphaeria enalia]
MRLTRAALRAEATQSPENETADASKCELPPTPLKERVPLGEVSPNKVAEPAELEVDLKVKKMPAKKSKARGGAKRGAKGKTAKVAEEPVDVEVLEDARQAAGSPASDAAVGELAKGPTDDVVQVPMSDQRPASPPSRAVRMTRRQLAKHEEELSKSQHRLPSPAPHSEPAKAEIIDILEEEAEKEKAVAEAQAEEQSVPQLQEDNIIDAQPQQETIAVQPSEEETAETQPVEQEIIEEQSAEQETAQLHKAAIATTPGVKITAEPEPKVLTSEKPCDEEATPITSRAPSRTPSKSPSRSPMRLEESIEAIDALEEAIEQVGKAIPILDTSADEKSPRKANFDASATQNAAVEGAKVTTVKRSPLAPPRLSRNPNAAPKSLKPTATAPRPSISRSVSVRAASSKEAGARKGSGEVVDYLASRRRPISMTFPAPPPPPKSSKPPTKPTFQLPGDAIAAKLKAQKEERLKREEEEAAKKPIFKARPVPTKKNVPATVRQTAASKARENLMQGKPAVEPKDAKPTVAPAKRMSTMNGVTIAPLPARTSSVKQHPNSVAISRTTSSSSANASNRASVILNPGPVTKSTVTPADAAAQRLKAREIFNRDKLEKEAREKERKEKEEAARKARAEAAERGRIASREWAEKQKLKRLGVPAASKAEAA